MLRKIRLTLAVLFFALITLLFLDFTGTLHTWFGWMAKIQFLPALLALNVGVVLALVILTLLLGRVYCSVICPLGVFQDVVAWFPKDQEEPLPLLARPVVAALRCIGSIRRRTGGRCALVCRPIGSLQCIRTYCQQPVCSPLPVGKQSAGLPGRTCRQLCVLRYHRVAEERPDFRHCSRYPGNPHRTGMERRTNLLQHHLPGRYHTWLPVQICLFEAGYRHG